MIPARILRIGAGMERQTRTHSLSIYSLLFLFVLMLPDRVEANTLAEISRITEANVHVEPRNGEALESPVFSHTGGFYTEAFQLELTTTQADASIYYTVDGSEPTAEARLYGDPIFVDSRAGDPNVLSMIRTTIPQTKWFEPIGEVFKATIIRARIISGNGEVGPIVSHTYFVDPLGANRYTLPVVSLVSDPDNFFGPQAGIYVPGAGFNGTDFNTANFMQSGREWERPVHIELFTEDGSRVLAADAGARIHGGGTRFFQVKSLRFYARTDYGPDAFDVQLFPDRPFVDYETFILRNSGNDFGVAHLRDGLVHRMVEHTSLDVQAFRPAVVFLSGEYWGILDLRERQDAAYLQTHYGSPTDAVDMLELPNEISEGSDAHYRAMLQYMATNGVATPEHFAYIQTQMDVDNFADYNIVEIFSNNTDWPHHNAENWRFQAEAFDPDAPYGLDGRWRWFLKDMDYGFGWSGREAAAQHNMLIWATAPDGNGHGAWATFLLRSLLENETFRTNFINRFADLLNTAFVPERVLPMIDEIAASLAPEMPEQIRRYQRPASMAAWESEVQLIRYFAQNRPAFQRQHIVEFFNLNGTAMVDLNVSSPNAGEVRINSILINHGTVGIVGDPYPWQGVYFQGVPVNVTAVPNFGFRFVRWEGLNNEQLAGEASVDILLTEDVSLTAHFEATMNVHHAYLPMVPR